MQHVYNFKEQVGLMCSMCIILRNKLALCAARVYFQGTSWIYVQHAYNFKEQVGSMCCTRIISRNKLNVEHMCLLVTSVCIHLRGYRDILYTNNFYTWQSLYELSLYKLFLYVIKFIRDKVYTGTKFIRGQSLYGDKVYTGQSLYGDKVYTETKFIQTFFILYLNY